MTLGSISSAFNALYKVALKNENADDALATRCKFGLEALGLGHHFFRANLKDVVFRIMRNNANRKGYDPVLGVPMSPSDRRALASLRLVQKLINRLITCFGSDAEMQKNKEERLAVQAAIEESNKYYELRYEKYFRSLGRVDMEVNWCDDSLFPNCGDAAFLHDTRLVQRIKNHLAKKEGKKGNKGEESRDPEDERTAPAGDPKDNPDNSKQGEGVPSPELSPDGVDSKPTGDSPVADDDPQSAQKDGDGDEGVQTPDDQESEAEIGDANRSVKGFVDVLSLKYPDRSTVVAANVKTAMEAVPTAGVRLATLQMLKLIRSHEAGGLHPTPRINSKALVEEFITKRFQMSRVRNKRGQHKRKALILVDVSGSCSAYSDDTLKAAVQCYKAAQNDVVIIWHVNGYVEGILGDFNYKAYLCANGDVAFENAHWGCVFAFGDEDAIYKYETLCRNGSTLYWLDSYDKGNGCRINDRKTTIFRDKFETLKLVYAAGFGGDIDDLNKLLRVFVRKCKF